MNTTLESAARTAAPLQLKQGPTGLPWLEVVSHLDPKYGGLSAAVPALSAAVAEACGQTVALAAFCESEERFSPRDAGGVAVRHFPLQRRGWMGQREAEREFRGMVEAAGGVHIHGLWQHSTERAARVARELNRPYLVSAHGMLERWALRQRRWKKAVYAALVERPLLRRAACLHALTEAEAEDYRRFGLRNPVAVIPNGVTVRAGMGPRQFLEQFPELRGQRLVLFLGRLHPKKGLRVLCEAWSDAEARWPEARLVIAGPEFENSRQELERRCAELGCKRVTFTGMLDDDLKWSALRAAEVFVLPSYSEGLSVSVLEAMGVGLPVIVSRACNVPAVSRAQCGWEIEPERGPLAAALDECLRMPEAGRLALGANGRELVRNKYSWERVGRQMADVYGWLGGGARPDGVFAGEVEVQTRSAKGAAA